MRRAMLLLSAAALAACATTGEPGRGSSGAEATTFDLHAATGDSLTATCDERGCTSPQLQVSKTADGFAGSLSGRAIELQTGAQGVSGSVGGQPVTLQVGQQNGGLQLSGMFAGQLSDLRLSGEALQGHVGRCAYDLHAVGNGRYAGNRTCADGPTSAEVRIPSSITSRPAADQAALLALLLAH